MISAWFLSCHRELFFIVAGATGMRGNTGATGASGPMNIYQGTGAQPPCDGPIGQSQQ